MGGDQKGKGTSARVTLPDLHWMALSMLIFVRVTPYTLVFMLVCVCMCVSL